MVGIYRDVREATAMTAAAKSLAPTTPSRRKRGLGANSIGGDGAAAAAADRRKKALTPKDPNRKRRKSSLIDKKVGISKSLESTKVKRSAATGTTPGKKSRIVQPKASSSNLSKGKVSSSSDVKTKSQAGLSKSNLQQRNNLGSKSSLKFRSRLGSTSTAGSASASNVGSGVAPAGLSESAGRVLLSNSKKREATDMEDPSESGSIAERKALTSLPSRTDAKTTTADPSSSSSSSTTAIGTPEQTTRSSGNSGTKARNDGGNKNGAASTPPSTSILRDFIQQRRKAIRSGEKVASEDDDDAATDVVIIGQQQKSVTFMDETRSDSGKRSQLEQTQADPLTAKQEETTGGIFMDLSQAFRSEKPSASTSSSAKAGTAAKKLPSIPTAKPKSLPVLSLGNFQESLWLDFGDESRNVVGKTRSLSFLLEAPLSSKSKDGGGYHSVEFERIPFKKGFNLVVEDDMTNPSPLGRASSDANSIDCDGNSSRRFVVGDADDESTATDRSSPTILCIRDGDKKRLRLMWTPTEVGGVRESIHLKLPRGRIRITAHGNARSVDNGKKKSRKKASKVAENYTSGSISAASQLPPTTPHQASRKASRIRRIVASTPAPDFSTPRTVYSKSSPASLVTSASKTRTKITYDTEWAEKQCDAFAKWLNYTFQPTEDDAHELSVQNGVDKSAFTRSGLRTLLLHRRRAQGRKKAMQLYQTNEMRSIRQAIEAEIDCGKLAIRSDRDVFADVALRGQIMSLLMSYTTPWLRLGLETIFGEILSADISSNSSDGAILRPKAMLKRFIIERVFSNPSLTKKYTGGRHATGAKTLSGRFEREYKKAMRQHCLRCILLLVAFLDRAKTDNILESAPCLFIRKAEVKSSRDVVTVICRDLLFKEGNIFKHLAKLGLTVVYKQEPIDEYNYTVDNLAVDLRDGVRLSRMAEILTNDKSSSLIEQMRVPTVSRLQKLHNTEVALDALIKAGVPNLGDIATHHIVDGHRPRVLKLLWSTIAHFKLPTLLDLDLLREEIDNVHRANKSRRVLSMKYIGNHQIDAAEDDKRVSSLDGVEAEIGELLLEWCKEVCSCFGLSVENFSSSFADGKALCLLLHYYHPGMLKRSEILPTYRDLPKDFALSKSGEQYEKALANERRNSTLASKRMSELGGVPGMLPISTSCEIPEEKSTLLCVAYLCSRLMESSKEILATIAIQNCYRRYQNRVLLERKKLAAVVIFQYWQENKTSYFSAQRQRYGLSVRVIERFLFRNKDKIEALRARRELKEAQDAAASRIQASIRRFIATRTYQRMVANASAAATIQAAFRGFVEYCKYKQTRSASVIVQSTYRRHIVLAALALKTSSATAIQKSWRGFVSALQFQCNLLDIINSQCCARRWLAERDFKRRKCAVRNAKNNAATIIQRACQRYKANKNSHVKNICATRIQASWRRFQGELDYMNTLMDIICIQSYARRLVARRQTRLKLTAIVQLQQAVRMWLSKRRVAVLRKDRNELHRIEAAAIICQRYARRMVAIQQVATLWSKKQAATTIQSLYRGSSSRHQLSIEHRNATKIQSAWRGFHAELQYECQLVDIVYAQACTRRYLAIQHATKRRTAIVRIQSALRCCIAVRQVRARKAVNSEVDKFVAAVVVCQSAARRRRAVKRVNRRRSRVALLNSSATKMQAIWRGYSVEVQYYYTLLSIICVQSVIRRHQACVEADLRMYSALVVQCASRQWLARRQRMRALRLSEEERAFQRLCSRSSIAIQRMVRGAQARAAFKKYFAARQIQKTWRGYVQNVDYMVSILSTITIQASARSMIQRRRLGKKKQSAIILEGFGRGIIARATMQRQVAAAMSIQSFYRGRLAIAIYQEHQKATIKVQSSVRGMMVRSDIAVQHFAANEIQRVWRGYQANIDYIMVLIAVIQIQSIARMAAARNLLLTFNEERLAFEVERRHQNATARKIQLWYRYATEHRVLTRNAVTIQSAARALVARNRMAKMKLVIVLVQSAYRAHVVRLTRTRKARVLAHRIERANRRAKAEPEMRLGVRTTCALDVLQSSKRLSEVIRAIKTLEVSTRLSGRCCNAFAVGNAPDILYALIRTCNRSLPHIELLHYVLLTLKNVARYPDLLSSVSSNDSLEILMDLLQMYRDKNNLLCLSVALLERIVLNNENLLDVCRAPENVKRLNGIRSLCKKRQGMVRNSYKDPSEYDLKRGIQGIERILKALK